MSLLALIGGLLMLVAGGEALVSGASKFALKHGMKPMVVGLTIVAFGTSMPELFVSLAASFQNHVDIMIGNVVGSNIANIGLVLALSALIRPPEVEFPSVGKDLGLVVAVSALVTAVAVFGFFHRGLGLLLVAGLVWYTVSSCRNSRDQPQDPDLSEERAERESNLKIIGLQGFGLLLLAYGSDLFIEGAVKISAWFGVPELVVGLTVAAVGTSLPELASSLSAIRRKESDILVGNIVGSNLFNLMMVLGGTAALKPFPMAGELLARDLPTMLGYALALLLVIYFRHRIGRLPAGIMLGGYGLYIWGLV
ncbi:MAG: calcium/sodium antiporter [Proteobacteria bacterium]|nr:calcium/sodium antiporter [Pseudomonadota bacterium]MBU1738918.1 calcium/sodium antiporter [Pseudomonadota bacterium]